VLLSPEQPLTFGSERQYKDRVRLWGIITYKKRNKKRDKKLQLETGDTTASDNPSSAVSYEGETSHHITKADPSISPGVNHTGQRRTRVSKMPQRRLQCEANAQGPPAVYSELASTRSTTSSNPEPIRSPTPPTQSARPYYLGGDIFEASALLPGMAMLPGFVDPLDELETMGITTAAQNGSSQAEPTSERPGDTDIGQSFGSSNKSSGTIDSNNPKSEYDIVEDEYMQDLY
jgi:hypothetical protein